MAVDEDTVQHIARLARIDVRSDELESLTRELAEVVDFVSRLGAVDTSGIEPLAHPHAVAQRLREDTPEPPTPRAELQSLAPAAVDGLYLVPRALD